MHWPFARRNSRPAPTRQPHVRPMALALAEAGIPFVCSTCGRSDLAPAGAWDPPVCEDCDAAINLDAQLEEQFMEEVLEFDA